MIYNIGLCITVHVETKYIEFCNSTIPSALSIKRPAKIHDMPMLGVQYTCLFYFWSKMLLYLDFQSPV